MGFVALVSADANYTTDSTGIEVLPPRSWKKCLRRGRDISNTFNGKDKILKMSKDVLDFQGHFSI